MAGLHTRREASPPGGEPAGLQTHRDASHKSNTINNEVKAMSQIPTFTAHDGLSVPQIGFGTYKLNGHAGVDVIVDAVRTGYRLLDSAFNYENEGAVGQAVTETIKQGLATREELTVVSKLPGRRQAYDQALYTIQESLFRTGLDYLDLYLIHWPNPLEDLYVEAWRALIEAQKRGYLKHIGVCNFLPEHLDRLERETGVMPAVNQIELHPNFPQEEQLAYDSAHGIVTQAWSPLGRANEILQNSTIETLARKYGKTVPQVILRWITQRGAMPIPKSSSVERQAENLFVFDFELAAEDLAAITALGKADGRLKDQDPAVYQEF